MRLQCVYGKLKIRVAAAMDIHVGAIESVLKLKLLACLTFGFSGWRSARTSGDERRFNPAWGASHCTYKAGLARLNFLSPDHPLRGFFHQLNVNNVLRLAWNDAGQHEQIRSVSLHDSCQVPARALNMHLK